MPTTPLSTNHPGETEARQRYASPNGLDSDAIDGMIQPCLLPSWIKFVESLPFFFMSTADDHGRCDASYRGRAHSLSGEAQPLIKALDEKRLVFPDFSGNGMFASLGNILVNPNIGLLFIDFQNIQRLRVNGHAEILDKSDVIKDLWPDTDRGVLVTVTQAFGNCRARIPRMSIIDEDPLEY